MAPNGQAPFTLPHCKLLMSKRDVQEQHERTIPEDVVPMLLQFARSSLAAVSLRGKTYLSIGGVSMGIAGCIVDEQFFTKYLGMKNAYVDMMEVNRRIDMKIYDPAEFSAAMSWVKLHCLEGEDPNPEELKLSREQKDQDWETSVLMSLIVRDLMIGNPKLAELGFEEESAGHNAIASGFQGQRAWTDCRPCGDFMEAILNSSFDWNGLRTPYIVATENDNLNAVTMLFGHLLTNSAQIFADVRSYWSPSALRKATGWEPDGMALNGFIHLINSGPAALDGTGRQTKHGKPAMKPHWEITREEADACLNNTIWRPVHRDQFYGGGYSSNFATLGDMPVTMARINLVDGLGPVLQIAEGFTLELPVEVHDILNKRTTATWPTTWFVPRLEAGNPAFVDVFSVMKEWGSNHCVLSYGHIGADLITLASILRIPVSMHNVPHESILRPTVWGAMGTRDMEGADFRACGLLGPLY
jgi:L-fucose isomerase